MASMRGYPFTATALVLGAVAAVWAGIPGEAAHKSFRFFVTLYGPSFVFSLAVVIFAITRYRAWSSLLLLILSPFIYFGGGHILFQWEDRVMGASLIASLVTAYAFLATTRLLVFRRCPWSTLFGWGALSAVAGIPFLPPLFKLAPEGVGGLWFWGFHIFLWYAAVGHTIDRMAHRTSH
jgi:hypothetical protein